MNLTEEQLAAITAEHGLFMVSAAAGSGKTTVLTERYLHLVQQRGLKPHEILTITFTKKAAAEMKQRIVRLLTDAGLPEEAQAAETGPVQTIHSFCDRVLRENALAAGVDPEFELVPNLGVWVDEEVQRVLMDDTMQEPAIQLFIAERSEQDWMGRNLCETIPAKIIGSLRGTHWTPEAVRNRAANFESMVEPFRPYLHERASRDKLKIGPEDDLLQVVMDPTLTRGAVRFYRWPDQVRELVEISRGALLIAAEAWDGLLRRFEYEQMFDHTETERRCVELIRSDSTVRDRLRSQHKALLLDEAQDNSPIQDELAQILGLENTMMVGDAQQSIYGFRQAAPHLFQRRINETPSLRLSRNMRSKDQILNFIDECFRSRWSDSYAPMAKFEFDTPSTDFSRVEFWEADGDAKPEIVAQNVEHLVRVEGCSPGSIAILCRTHTVMGDYLDALRERGIDAEISGGRKFHSRMIVRDVANALESLLDPSGDFALFATLRSPFVGMSLDGAIRCALAGKPLINHLEKVELELADRAELDRFTNWFVPLAKVADRLSAWEALSQVFEKSGLMDRLAMLPSRSQAIANARKLLMRAAEDREVRPQEFAENIRRSQQQAIDEEGDAPTNDPNAPVVRLMTIHAAKGLEFPTVILPDTESGYGELRKNDLLRFRPEEGLLILNDREELWPRIIVEEIMSTELVQEEYRLDYVAMTRAKERLVFAIPSKRPKKASLARMMYDLFLPVDGPRGGIVVREAPALIAVPGGGA